MTSNSMKVSVACTTMAIAFHLISDVMPFLTMSQDIFFVDYDIVFM